MHKTVHVDSRVFDAAAWEQTGLPASSGNSNDARNLSGENDKRELSSVDNTSYTASTRVTALNEEDIDAILAGQPDGANVSTGSGRGRGRGRGRLRVVLRPDASAPSITPDGVVCDEPPAAGQGRVCHVCGEPGHNAGFVGAVYVDCPNYACYLCKQVGHTTATCVYRPKPQQADTASTSKVILSKHWNGIATPYRHQRLEYDRISLLRCRELLSGTQSAMQDVASNPLRSLMVLKNSETSFAHPYMQRWRVSSGVLKLHTRRTTFLTFHPQQRYADIVVSTDKSGELAVWRFLEGGGNYTVHSSYQGPGTRFAYGAHRWLINAGDWALPGVNADSMMYTASADGTLRLQDIEQGKWVSELIDLNPREWTGETSEWRMFYSIATGANVLNGSATGLIVGGDDVGRIWGFDARAKSSLLGFFQAHKKGSKVQSLQFNPMDGQMLASASNDWTCKIWDLRMQSFATAPTDWYRNNTTAATSSTIDPSSLAAKDIAKGPKHDVNPLAVLQHKRVVNSATFSPNTGNRLLTTCIDNRLRVWDGMNAISSDALPTLELVHSHDFARYLSPFRAHWDPKDASERTVVCGRYISEAFDVRTITGEEVAGGSEALAPLHPIDIIDVGAPQHAQVARVEERIADSHPARNVAQLVDPLMRTIAPVIAVHPNLYYIACGTSKNVYMWAPDRTAKSVEQQRTVLDVSSWSSRFGWHASTWHEDVSPFRTLTTATTAAATCPPPIYAGPDCASDGRLVNNSRLLGADDDSSSDDEAPRRGKRNVSTAAKKRKAATPAPTVVEAGSTAALTVSPAIVSTTTAAIVAPQAPTIPVSSNSNNSNITTAVSGRKRKQATPAPTTSSMAAAREAPVTATDQASSTATVESLPALSSDITVQSIAIPTVSGRKRKAATTTTTRVPRKATTKTSAESTIMGEAAMPGSTRHTVVSAPISSSAAAVAAVGGGSVGVGAVGTAGVGVVGTAGVGVVGTAGVGVVGTAAVGVVGVNSAPRFRTLGGNNNVRYLGGANSNVRLLTPQQPGATTSGASALTSPYFTTPATSAEPVASAPKRARPE